MPKKVHRKIQNQGHPNHHPGDKEFNAICADFNLNPSMVRKWKQEFLQNTHRAFDSDSGEKA